MYDTAEKDHISTLLNKANLEKNERNKRPYIISYHSKAEMIHWQILQQAIAVVTLLGPVISFSAEKRAIYLLY